MSTTTLKFIALIFMIVDHIAEFIPGTPIFFHYIGRVSAPIFFFCMAWGFYYTKNKKRYLLRMYLFGACMELINIILETSYNKEIDNNIFIPLFLSSLLIYILNQFKVNYKKGVKLFILFITWQIINTYIILFIDYNGLYLYLHGNKINTNFLFNIFANLFFNESGITFIVLGILFYYFKDNKLKLSVTFIGFSIFYTILYATNIPARVLLKIELLHTPIIYNLAQFFICGILRANFMPVYGVRFYTIINYYWMVIFALPFLLLYNYKKGRGFKYFFYFFYPLHIYILYFISNIIS